MSSGDEARRRALAEIERALGAIERSIDVALDAGPSERIARELLLARANVAHVDELVGDMLRTIPGRPVVLVVDDDHAIREALQEMLEYEGYDVALAGDGREALALLRRIDRKCVVLLDLMMPEVDGWQVLYELDRDRISVPVVVVSAVSSPHLPPGVHRLAKPLDRASLLRAIDEAAQRS